MDMAKDSTVRETDVSFQYGKTNGKSVVLDIIFDCSTEFIAAHSHFKFLGSYSKGGYWNILYPYQSKDLKECAYDDVNEYGE